MDQALTDLVFPRSLYEEIVSHARSVYPEECCGLVVSPPGGRPTRVVPMENTFHSPVRYEMNPKEQFRVQKELRREGVEIWGIYHSHPATPPYPSETDVRLAFYPDLVYLLTSLATEPPPLRGYRIRNGVIDEIPLKVSAGDP